MLTRNLESVFVAAGFKPLKPRKERPQKVQKCFKCGSDMALVVDSNILVCTGDIETKDDAGNVKLVPCRNFFLFRN